jgi:hypothetical protein
VPAMRRLLDVGPGFGRTLNPARAER